MRLLTITPSRQLLLLPPEQFTRYPGFGRLDASSTRRSRLMANMQRLRGRIYLGDGAIDASDLTLDGRHQLAIDAESWHVLLVDSKDRVYGCARYRSYTDPVRFADLSVGRSEIAHSDIWGSRLERAVARELEQARRRRISFVEVGGWALSEEMRYSAEALRIALAMYSLAENLGGCIGLTTATVRHSSASILRKIGGDSLETEGGDLPRYYDSRYNCEMEILRFDSSQPNSRYREWVARTAEEVAAVQIVTSGVRETALVPVSAPAEQPVAASLQLVPQLG